MFKANTQKGFTLLEVLLVIAIIAILTAIVIIALNPTKNVKDAHATQRIVDTNTIWQAVEQYGIDNNGIYPTEIDTTLRMIGTASDGCDVKCGDSSTTTPAECINLDPYLVSKYIAGMPFDPTLGSTERTYYAIRKTPFGRIKMISCYYVPGFSVWDTYSIIGPSVLQWQGMAISDDGNYISGTVLNGPIYVSTNGGQTFTSRASNRAWRGIAMSSDGQYQTAVVFGSTTVPGYIYRSTNYGTTWTQASTLNKRWLNIGMSKNGQYQTAISYHTTVGGLYGRVVISSDYGATWSEVSALNNRTFGGIAVSETGQHQIISDTTRKVMYSNDYGQTWSQILETTNNYVQGLAISADGTHMTAVEDGGNIWISSNQGASWTEIINTKAWVNVEMSSDGKYQTAVSSGTSRYMAVSYNYGQTWTQVMSGIVVQWTTSAMSANGVYQVAGSFGSGSTSRIYKSIASQ